MTDSKKTRQMYERYVKEGGLYVSRLFATVWVRAVDPAGLEQISGGNLLRICLEDEERKNEIAGRVGDIFRSENADIIRLYAASSCLMERLRERRKGIRLTEYQKFYPELIRETYGANVYRIADGVYLDESGRWEHFEKDMEMPKKRKVALSYFLDLVEQNSENGFVTYDFESDEAFRTIERLDEMIKRAKNPENLIKTLKLFRFVEKDVNLKGMSDAFSDLLIETEGEKTFADAYENVLDLRVETCMEGENVVFRAPKQDYASEYILFLNDIPVRTSEKPEFTVCYDRLPDEIYVRIEAVRTEDDIEGLIDAAAKMKTRNGFLQFASSRTNRFLLLYERYIFAKAALGAVKRISPVTFESQLAAINMTKTHRQEEMWPLACLMDIDETRKRDK